MKMNSKYLLFALLFLTNASFGQELNRGNTWVLGFWPVVTFDFNSSLQIDTLPNPNAMYLGSSISDTVMFIG